MVSLKAGLPWQYSACKILLIKSWAFFPSVLWHYEFIVSCNLHMHTLNYPTLQPDKNSPRRAGGLLMDITGSVQEYNNDRFWKKKLSKLAVILSVQNASHPWVAHGMVRGTECSSAQINMSGCHTICNIWWRPVWLRVCAWNSCQKLSCQSVCICRWFWGMSWAGVVGDKESFEAKRKNRKTLLLVLIATY